MAKEAVFAAVRAEIASSRIDLGNPVEFARLVEIATAVAEHSNDPDDHRPERIRNWTAMALLGPRVGLPADGVCVSLEDITRDFYPDGDNEAVLDVVAAFGCGWQRPGLGYRQDWDGIWPGASTYLEKRAQRVCASVLNALQDRLHVHFPDELQTEHLLGGTASSVSAMLVQPVAPVALSSSLTVTAGDTDPIYARLFVATDDNWSETIPTGARAVYLCSNGEAQDDSNGISFGAGDIVRLMSSETQSTLRIRSDSSPTRNCEKRPTAGQSFEFNGTASLETYACSCGEVDCGDRHRLSAWDPKQKHNNLQNFLYSAIRGKMQTLKAKDFAQGLLGSFWARHGFADGSRLRLAEVIHRACMVDDCGAQDSEQKVCIYMGDRCGRCNTAATSATPMLARERLIFVDTEQPQWEFREFWRCAHEGCTTPDVDKKRNNLFEPTPEILSKAAQCQHCGEQFWSPEQAATVGRCLSGADTVLEGIRAVEKVRRKERCKHCDELGTDACYCTICEQHSRPGKLPGRPTWFFAPARP